MLQPHRRSNRRRNTTAAYNKANRIEAVPGKKYLEKKTEVKIDIYEECPNFEDYEYDKDAYLANDRYATMIDNDIAELIQKKEWTEAIKLYEETLAKEKQLLKLVES